MELFFCQERTESPTFEKHPICNITIRCTKRGPAHHLWLPPTFPVTNEGIQRDLCQPRRLSLSASLLQKTLINSTSFTKGSKLETDPEKSWLRIFTSVSVRVMLLFPSVSVHAVLLAARGAVPRHRDRIR